MTNWIPSPHSARIAPTPHLEITMPLLYTDPCFLNHETGQHPECPARLHSISARLAKTDLSKKFTDGKIRDATVEELTRVHSAKHVERVRLFAEAGGGRIESDTTVSRESYNVALKAAGTACDAVDQVLGEPTTDLGMGGVEDRPVQRRALAAHVGGGQAQQPVEPDLAGTARNTNGRAA